MNVTEGFPGGTEPRKRIAPDGDKLEENSRLRKAKSHRADPQVGNESHLDLSADACNNGVQKIHHVKAVPATVEAPPVNGGRNAEERPTYPGWQDISGRKVHWAKENASSLSR